MRVSISPSGRQRRKRKGSEVIKWKGLGTIVKGGGIDTFGLLKNLVFATRIRNAAPQMVAPIEIWLEQLQKT